MFLFSVIQRVALLAGGAALLSSPVLANWDECRNSYDGNSGQLSLSCIPMGVDGASAGLVGGTLVFRGQNLFELTETWTYKINSAYVTDVRIVTGNIPVVLVTAVLSNGCVFSTPLIDTVISGFEIRLDVRVFSQSTPPEDGLVLCTEANRTVIFPVVLNDELRTGTYTVAANGVSKTFDYVSPGYQPPPK